MKRYLRYLGPVLITAIFCLAIYLLYHKLKQYSVAQIRDCMQQVSSWRILVSLLSTCVSYMILVGYDWLAIRAIHKSLPLPRVCLVSFVGQTVSYNFGALLGGTTVRYRFYSSWNFSVSDIVRLVLMLAVTFWVGVLGLCGIFFMVAPPHIPDELVAHLGPFTDLRILGGILFIVAALYLLCCFRIRRPIHILDKEFVFPAPHLAVAQLIVAGLDIIAAAWCMYILLPGSLNLTFLDFIPSYLLAQVAVVLTHVPGGVGIFELIIINLTQTTQTEVVFAGVLLFRLIYYILPLLLAAAIFAVYEIVQRKTLLHDAGRMLSIFSHSIVAYITFACGIFFLVSAITPIPQKLLTSFHSAFPHVVSASGMYLCSFAGAVLLILSYGLEQRQKYARNGTVLLLLAGIAGALLNCFSWVTALGGGFVCLLLLVTGRRFYRTSPDWASTIPPYWLGGICAALLFVFCAAFFLYHSALDLTTVLSLGFSSDSIAGINATRTLRALAGVPVLTILFIVLLRKRKTERQVQDR